MRFNDEMPRPQFRPREERFTVREPQSFQLVSSSGLWRVYSSGVVLGLFGSKEKAVEAYPLALEVA